MLRLRTVGVNDSLVLCKIESAPTVLRRLCLMHAAAAAPVAVLSRTISYEGAPRDAELIAN